MVRPGGTKPDFTVTRAVLESAWGDTDGSRGVMIAWETKSAGFGTVTLHMDKDGTLTCDNEAMSVRFVKEVFAKLIDGAKLQDD